MDVIEPFEGVVVLDVVKPLESVLIDVIEPFEGVTVVLDVIEQLEGRGS